MDDHTSVKVVILNWNGYQDTVECVSSLKEDGVEESAVVLVDNGSDNGEGSRLKELFPDIQLIQNKFNRGFSGGNNDGITRAIKNGAEYVILLNNDCIVEKGWFSGLVNAISSTSSDFAASRIMFYPDKETICTDEDVIFPDGSGIAVNRYKRFSHGEGLRPIISACAASAIYSVKALEEAKIAEGQYFDEMYFAYNEDIDLAMRLSAKRCRGVTVPDAVVYHKHSMTSGKYSFFKMFHSEKNRIMNEMLNFPAYFFFAGEMFFLVKTFWAVAGGIFGARGKAGRYAGETGVINVVWALIKARLWVAANLPGILRDRRRRKARGLVGKYILKKLSWDINAFRK